jgi:hypothetical protein
MARLGPMGHPYDVASYLRTNSLQFINRMFGHYFFCREHFSLPKVTQNDLQPNFVDKLYRMLKTLQIPYVFRLSGTVTLRIQL